MYGINRFNYKDENLIKKMMSFTRNRGPDFKDFLCEEDISLGHDRLSILDLDTKIPNDFLIRNDNIFMNFGIEERVPFLDE
jgi:asparagine synthase (glutamine-hydrolysing)